MKKAFSLVEVIICVVILSFTMITLLQIKSNNIFLLNKSKQKTKFLDYILLAMDIDDNSHNKNKDIFLDKEVNFDNDDIRKELKEVKVHIKDKQLNEFSIDKNDLKLKVKTYVRTYEIENKIKKSIYSFKVIF